MSENCCRSCGNIFISKGCNALYCPECAKMRKRTCDQEAWRRRYQKSNAGKFSKRDVLESRLSSQHARELGLSSVYYNLWKEQNPKSYRKWMDEHIEIEQGKVTHGY